MASRTPLTYGGRKHGVKGQEAWFRRQILPGHGGAHRGSATGREGAVMRHLLVVVSLVLAAARAVPASEWRTYGGNLRRLFFSPAETTITPDNVGRLRVKWKFPTGAIVAAQPAVAELAVPGAGRTQVAFIASWDGYLYALRTRDGTQLWRFRMDEQPGAPYPFAASVHVQRMGGTERLFGAGGETVYCLDARTGAELWRFDAGTRCAVSGLCGFRAERNEVESSPIVATDQRGRPLVLFGMDVNGYDVGKGGFYAIDARDGRLVWFFDLESGSTCRPFPDDDIRRFDGYHTEAELGLPPGFLATRPGCGF